MVNLLPWGETSENIRAKNNHAEHIYLEKILGYSTYVYLQEESIRGRLIDSVILMDSHENNPALSDKIYDWQYFLFPTSIALELSLFKIARELEMTVDERNTIGQVYTKNAIENLLDTIADNRVRNKVAEEINTLGGFIQAYRNDPLHPAKELKIENYIQAKSKHSSILEKLKSLIENLIETGMIQLPSRLVIGIKPWDSELDKTNDHPSITSRNTTLN